MNRQELFLKVIEGQADQAEQARAQDLLLQDAESVDEFLALAMIHSTLQEHLASKSRLDGEDVLLHANDDVWQMVVAEATRSKRSHEIEQMSALKHAGPVQPHQDWHHPPLDHTTAVKPPRVIVIPSSLAWLATAAAIAVVAIIAFQFRPAKPATPTAIDLNPHPHAPAEQTLGTLVSLSPDAAWAPTAHQYAIGDKIPAGQVLLSTGTAEITLSNGVHLVLTGQTHFELRDTMCTQLIHGAILADVPPAGHGFEVAIPGGVVTDLGTRFSIDVPEEMDAPSQVVVHEGVVNIRPEQENGAFSPLRVVRDQFARVDRNGQSISLFARERTPRTVRLPAPNSGIGIEHGETDPRWTISSDTDPTPKPLYVIGPLSRDLAKQSLMWLPSDIRSSQWLCPYADAGYSNTGKYTFTTHLNIPAGIDPTTVKLSVRYIADDILQAIRINGEQIAGPFERPHPDLNPSRSEQYQTWSGDISLDTQLLPGDNEIKFVIYNGSGSTGFRVEFDLTGVRQYSPIDLRRLSIMTEAPHLVQSNNTQ